MENKVYNFNKIQNLKHGENTFQSAALYNYDKEIDWNLVQGIELNYNDILNATTTIEILAEFYDVSAFAAVKFNNPAVVALGSDVNNAFEKAIDSDPIALFGATVGFSKEISPILARKLIEFQIDTIVAPEFSEETIRVLNKYPNHLCTSLYEKGRCDSTAPVLHVFCGVKARRRKCPCRPPSWLPGTSSERYQTS